MPRSLPASVLSVLIAASLLPGCADRSADPATPPPAPPSSSPTQPDEPPGMIACGRAVLAVRDATLMNPGVIAAITTAAGTAEAPVADAAQRLSAAYDEALAAHGKDTEPDAIAAVSGAAAKLAEICRDSGLQTAG